MTRRAQILDAIETRLKSIRVANGYQTDAGINVFRWIAHRSAEEVRPVLVFRDPLRKVSSAGDDAALGEEYHYLTIEIEGAVDDDEEASGSLALIGDLRRAFGTDPELGGLVNRITWDAPDEINLEEGETIIGLIKCAPVVEYEVPSWQD